MMRVDITRWRGLTAIAGSRRAGTRWPALVAWLTRPVAALGQDWPEHSERHPGWSPALFAGDKRSKEGVERVSLLVLDVDHGVASVAQALAPWQGIEGCWHTTRRSTPEAPRLRVVLRLSRPVTPAEFALLWRWAQDHAATAGVELDRAPSDPSRFWFLPAAGAQAGELEGQPIDVEAVLSLPVAAPEPVAPAPASQDRPRAREACQTGDRPGDAWARETSWAAILEPHGWKRDGKQGEQDVWTRPGKPGGVSATCNGQHLYVFTSAAPPLEARRSYDKLGLFATLEHGGDIREAARVLGQRGFGEQRQAQAQDETRSDEPVDPELAAAPVAESETRPGMAGDVPPEQMPPDPERQEQPSGPPQTSAIVTAWQPLDLAVFLQAPPARRWLLRHPTLDGQECPLGQGDGLLPLGKVALLSADGGGSKTQILVALAVSIATGRPWLGHYHVDWAAQRGRILLGLAEEDAEEVHRRLYRVAESLALTDSERARCCSQIVALPLAGCRVALTAPTMAGTVIPTGDCDVLRQRLVDDAGPDGWAAVVLDPLARWAGADVESSNLAATSFVQALETLCCVPGTPTVIAAHHSSKTAQRSGSVDVRGVSGIRDAVRWVGTLRPDGQDVLFMQDKSNYSIPMAEPLRLVRGAHGLLRAPGPAEQSAIAERQEEARQAALDADVKLVVEAVRKEGGRLPTIDAIIAAAGMRAGRGRAAIRLAVARSALVRVGPAREQVYELGRADT